MIFVTLTSLLGAVLEAGAGACGLLGLGLTGMKVLLH